MQGNPEIVLANKIKRICQTCGKEFWVWPSVIKYLGARFCSKKCYLESTKISENNPNWRGGKIKLICQWCGNEYFRSKNQTDRSKYCCQLCHNKANGNKLKGINISEEIKLKISLSKMGIPRLNFRGKNASNWRGGIARLPYRYEFDEKLKDKIRKRDNHECQICGKTQEQNLIEIRRKLDIHHIDYSKDNNLEDNLITLCLSCHSKTNFNRIFWKIYFKSYISGGETYDFSKDDRFYCCHHCSNPDSIPEGIRNQP